MRRDLVGASIPSGSFLLAHMPELSPHTRVIPLTRCMISNSSGRYHNHVVVVVVVEMNDVAVRHNGKDGNDELMTALSE